jgi:hypothetical protein
MGLHGFQRSQLKSEVRRSLVAFSRAGAKARGLTVPLPLHGCTDAGVPF